MIKRRSVVTRARAALLAAPALVLVACQMIAGIEDDSFTSPPPISEQCQQYCAVVQGACKGSNAVYSGLDTCLAVCSRLPAGSTVEFGNENTVACRANQARLAAETEPEAHCPAAGPGGGNPSAGPADQCGSNCASYCLLLNTLCKSTAAQLTNCEAQCAAVPDTGKFDAVANYNGDTLQCRLVHLSAAAFQDPTLHCAHAQLRPSAPRCAPAAGAPFDCAAFCRVAKTACTGDNVIYETDEQCMAVCAKLPPGTPADEKENTMGCRDYHAYNALFAPDTHCVHAGPGGNGHCGQDAPDKTGNCESYCHLAVAACPAQFAAKYDSESSCQKECSNQPVEFGGHSDAPLTYKVKSVDMTPTLQCRLLHVARALSDAAECANVFGGPSCPGPGVSDGGVGAVVPSDGGTDGAVGAAVPSDGGTDGGLGPLAPLDGGLLEVGTDSGVGL